MGVKVYTCCVSLPSLTSSLFIPSFLHFFTSFLSSSFPLETTLSDQELTMEPRLASNAQSFSLHRDCGIEGTAHCTWLFLQNLQPAPIPPDETNLRDVATLSKTSVSGTVSDQLLRELLWGLDWDHHLCLCLLSVSLWGCVGVTDTLVHVWQRKGD